MDKDLEKYYQLELNRLSIREKFHIGCKLLNDSVPELRPLPPNDAEILWEKIYKAEMLLQTENNQKQAISLLGECLEILDKKREDFKG
jgi:hypothetical protein